MTRNRAKFFGLLLIAIVASVGWQELGAKTPGLLGLFPIIVSSISLVMPSGSYLLNTSRCRTRKS